MKTTKPKYVPIDEEPTHFGYGLLLYPFLCNGERIHMCKEDMRALNLKHPYALLKELQCKRPTKKYEACLHSWSFE